MTQEIIADTLAFLERAQITWREVPAFNRVVASLLWERDRLIKIEKEKQTEEKIEN